MTEQLAATLNETLTSYVHAGAGLPGIVATVTDAERTIYEGAAGLRSVDDNEPLDPSSVLTVFSTTKAVAATAALRMIERGEIELDAPAKSYVPALGDVQVLETITADGEMVLRPPKRDITMRMLLLHTAGFGYSDFNSTYARLLSEGRLVSAGEATMASLTSAPLLFEPGEQWQYGLSMDWAGQVIQAVSGMRLRDAIQVEVLDPLEMHDTAFTLTPQMSDRFAPLHARGENGEVVALDYLLPQDPEIDMAGHGLYSTARDFTKLLRMWLAEGRGPHDQLLRRETIQWASGNGLGTLRARPLTGFNPFMTRDVDILPGVPSSFAYSFARTEATAATGRPAGTLSWVGLANTYFWIDHTTGVAAFWAANLLPLADPTALDAYLAFETVVYSSVSAAVTA